jgi:hypothetical protein
MKILTINTLFLTGASASLHAGLIQRHDPELVSRITITTSANSGTTLGSTFRLEATTIEKKGNKLFSCSTAERAGKLPEVEWAEFAVEVAGGTFDEGIVSVSRNLADLSKGKLVLNVSYRQNPELDTTIVLEMITGQTIVANYAGADGSPGEKGHREAVNGAPGMPGDTGKPGPEIVVFLKKISSPDFEKGLVCALIIDLSRHDTARFYLDPSAGSLTILASGGAGGYGGAGGHGAPATKEASRRAVVARGGRGGDGGNGGPGGTGGKLTVYVDPGMDVSQYPIAFKTSGGNGGPGGRGGRGSLGSSGTTPATRYVSQAQGSGKNGADGRPGTDGPPPVIVVLPVSDEMMR